MSIETASAIRVFLDIPRDAALELHDPNRTALAGFDLLNRFAVRVAYDEIEASVSISILAFLDHVASGPNLEFLVDPSVGIRV